MHLGFRVSGKNLDNLLIGVHTRDIHSVIPYYQQVSSYTACVSEPVGPSV